jgi:hypothetical protein
VTCTIGNCNSFDNAASIGCNMLRSEVMKSIYRSALLTVVVVLVSMIMVEETNSGAKSETNWANSETKNCQNPIR